MKTCPNPKCKTTGIPDEAKFCPKCGATLTDTPSPWREKYEEMQEVLEELQSEKRQWTLFDNERQRMLTVLNQDRDIELAMKEYIDIIRYNRITLPKKKFWHRVTGWCLLLLCLVSFVVTSRWTSEIIEILTWWGLIIITIGEVVLLFIGIPFFFMNGPTEKWLPTYNNLYITNFYEPFIERHMSDYKWIEALPANIKKILEIEIYEPETITNGIARRMEKLDKMIDDFDRQIKVLQEIQ